MSATTLWHDDFEAAGYQSYRDSFKDSDEAGTPVADRMYQGSRQKRIRDARGTRYFVNVDLYDFTKKAPTAGWSMGAEVQFSVQDEMAVVANVSFSAATIAETEAFFADLWQRMRWGYYEIDDADRPAANAVSLPPLPTAEVAK